MPTRDDEQLIKDLCVKHFGEVGCEVVFPSRDRPSAPPRAEVTIHVPSDPGNAARKQDLLHEWKAMRMSGAALSVTVIETGAVAPN